MKKALKIDGFNVKILRSVQRGSTYWVAWLQDHLNARAEAIGYEEVIKALRTNWDEIEAAYRDANLPVPAPARRQGKKRVLDKI